MHWSCLSRCSTSTFRSRHRSSTPPTPNRWPEPRPFEWRLAMQLPLSPPIASGSPMTPPRIRCVWYQGTLSYPVGKGIAVGWQSVYASSATLPNYLSGNIVFLVGSDALHDHASGSEHRFIRDRFHIFRARFRNVTIATTGSDTIDNGPMTLRPNDRYHVVSDGGSSWREVFRTNAVNPRFSGPPVAALLHGRHAAGFPGCGSHGVCQQWPQAKRSCRRRHRCRGLQRRHAAGSRCAVALQVAA